jgi:hypothetical protein
VPRRSKHPLLTGLTRRVTHFKSQNSVIQISVSKLDIGSKPLPKSVRLVRLTEKSAVKISVQLGKWNNPQQRPGSHRPLEIPEVGSGA